MENGLILRKSARIIQINGQARVIQFWYEETLQIAPEDLFANIFVVKAITVLVLLSQCLH